MTSSLRFGLIGAGMIAQTWARVLADASCGRVVAVADVRAEAARALAETLECVAFDDHQRLLDKHRDLDAVLVCTPPSTHSDIVQAAAAAGLAVLCEKPLAIDLKTARTMVVAADDAGVVLTMASKFRYVEDIVRARSLIASGLLGDVALLENAFTSRVDMTRRWNSQRATSGGGVLIDNGTHSADLVRYLLGPVTAVQAVAGRQLQELQVEDTVRLGLRTAGPVLITVDLSWSVDRYAENYVEIQGSRGTLQVGWRRSRYRRANEADWTVFGHGYDKLDAFRRQLENFCAAVRGEEPLLINSTDALASVQVIDRAYESIRDGRWLEVEPQAKRSS